MSHSLAEALREHTSNERRIARIVKEYCEDDEDVYMTKRQIGKVVDKYFSNKREREEEYEEVEEQAPDLVDATILTALTTMYAQTDRNDPYSRVLFDKMRRVAERLEPSEVGEDPSLDTIVNMSDRIRHFFPNHAEEVPKEKLFEIGRLAKEYHLERYQCAPSKMPRVIDGQERFINVYTVETAPDTLDRAIREVMSS